MSEMTARELINPTILAEIIEKVCVSVIMPPQKLTIFEMFDAYLKDKDQVLSPCTIRFYRIVQKNRFQSIMGLCPQDMTKVDWQRAVNEEARFFAPKTIDGSFKSIKTVVLAQSGMQVPSVRLPSKIASRKKFLQPAEVPRFVAAVAATKYAVPLLLALSSMRISEIDALDWRDIPSNPDFVFVRGARVLNEENKYIRKEQNKNETSSRPVPILIPELKAALERDRRRAGAVMPCSQNNLRLACHRICKSAGITDVGVHELRHSFASLCYHLRVPEEIAAQIGGWADVGTMRKIYTHIAQTDITRYQGALQDFYNSTSALK